MMKFRIGREVATVGDFNIDNVETFPYELRQALNGTLVCFNRASVVLANGIVSIETGAILMSRYPTDYAVAEYTPEILDPIDTARRNHFMKTGEWLPR